MSVCIGAICLKKNEPRIVLCSDRRLEDDISGSDACVKWDVIGGGFAALISADDFSLALAHVDIIRGHFAGRQLEDNGFLDELKVCASLMKRSVLDEFAMGRLGVTYDHLLKEGATSLPKDIRREIFTEIQSQHLGCEILVAGFIGKSPHLYGIFNDCAVRRIDAFEAVGSGATIARSALRQRGFVSAMSLDEAAYYVWEAKRFSEIAPGVGAQTDFEVLSPDGKMRLQHAAIRPALDGAYRKFGLQKYIRDDLLQACFPDA
jgi:hypothetical protein